MRKIVIAIVAGLVAGTANGSEPIRCGRWVVDESATVADLLNKCGEPMSKESILEDVRALGPTGAMIKVGTVVTERWIYDRGRRAAAVLVKIADGKIRSIERVPE
jgi:Protein of unknown function (DUF2845)